MAPCITDVIKSLPTTGQLLIQLRNLEACPTELPHGSEIFDKLLHAIALQLLASCYTLLPATSADNLPLFQQRAEPKVITALRLHSHHRFEPATGHHARASSETASWPGLYIRPTRKESLAEAVSLRRHSSRSRHHVLSFAASTWTDGSASPTAHDPCEDSSPASDLSSSEEERGLLSRLMCSGSTPKSPQRKHNTLFTNRLTTKRRKQNSALCTQTSQVSLWRSQRRFPRALQHITSQTVQSIPSTFRLRRTRSAESAPRIVVEEAVPFQSARKHSSNPSIGSPLAYLCNIPEIRRISATPAPSQMKSGISTSMRGCGGGDVIEDSGYVDECRPLRSIHSRSTITLPLPRPIPDTSLPANISIILPAQVASPPDYFTSGSSSQSLNNENPILKPGSDTSRKDYFPSTPNRVSVSPRKEYFASIHAATHVDGYKDNELEDKDDDLTEEREDAGPSIDECPRLQEIFAKIDASDDEYSRDSDMERARKRKSVFVAPDSAENDMYTETFGLRTDSWGSR